MYPFRDDKMSERNSFCFASTRKISHKMRTGKSNECLSLYKKKKKTTNNIITKASHQNSFPLKIKYWSDGRCRRIVYVVRTKCYGDWRCMTIQLWLLHAIHIQSLCFCVSCLEPESWWNWKIKKKKHHQRWYFNWNIMLYWCIISHSPLFYIEICIPYSNNNNKSKERNHLATKEIVHMTAKLMEFFWKIYYFFFHFSHFRFIN